MRRRLLLLLLLLPLLLCASGSALAHPALWVVRNGASTVYLFGTVHLLARDTDWRFPALQRALDRSQSLYLELTDDDQAGMAALVLRYGLDPAHPLSAQLSRAEDAELAAAAQAAGMPGGAGALDVMRPWLAALTLSVAPLLKAGLDPAQGVDKQLRAQMAQAGKPVHGLESAEQQIRFLADMPAQTQRSFLRETLRDTRQAGAELASLVGAWKNGDTAAIDRLEDDELRRREPALYRTLLVNRNAAWAETIAGLLARPGTVFVAVGAAHLAGPDSVQAQLARRGFVARTE